MVRVSVRGVKGGEIKSLDDLKSAMANSMKEYFSGEQLGAVPECLFDRFCEFFGVTSVNEKKMRDFGYPGGRACVKDCTVGINATRVRNTNLFVVLPEYNDRYIRLSSITRRVVARDFVEFKILKAIHTQIGSEIASGDSYERNLGTNGLPFVINQDFSPSHPPKNYDTSFRELLKPEYAFKKFREYREKRDLAMGRISSRICEDTERAVNLFSCFTSPME